MEVLEEPQMPRARGARQQFRRAAIQERTQECMTAVMTEGVAPCGVPGGASNAKGSRRKAPRRAAVQERTQERMTEVMTEGIAPVWRSRRSLGCQGLAAQGNNPCVTGVLTEVSAPVWRSRRSLGCQGLAAQGNNPGGMH